MRGHRTIFLTFAVVAFIASGCTLESPDPVAPEDLLFEPMVRINSPDSGSLYAATDTVTFSGVATDIEDGPDALQIVWSSDVDGILNADAPDAEGVVSFATGSLSYSAHLVKLLATDSEGHTGSDSILVYCNVPPPVTFFELEKDFNSVYLTWSRSTAPDFARYNIYRSANSGAGAAGELIQTSESLADTTFQDTSVIIGETCYYQVFVESEAGQTSGSEERTVVAGFFTVVDLDTDIGAVQAGPNSQYVFLSDRDNDRVLVVGVESGETEYEIGVGDCPLGLAVNPDRNELYVANSDDMHITVIDLALMAVSGEISLSCEPAYLAYSPVSGRLYATSANSWQDPSIIDVVNGVEIGFISDPSSIYSRAMCEVSQVSPFLYIGERGLSPASLYKVDISTDSPVLVLEDDHGSIGSNLQGMDLSADGTAVFLACGSPYYIQMLSTDTFVPIGSFDTGAYPTAVVVAPDGSTVYTGHGTDEVQVFNVATGVETGHFAVSDEVDDDALAIDPTGTWLFVVTGDYYSNRDLVIIAIGPQ